MGLYKLLDIFFTLFHGALVLFNLSGWAWHRTRRFHLAVISLTFLSWFGLGLYYGWGYCPSTDWHWQVKERLGETDLPASYIKYFADRLTGFSWNPAVIDSAVLIFGIWALLLSILFNRRDYRRRRSGKPH